MSGYGTEERPVAKTKDPLLRFLAGCAVVALVVVAILIGCVWYVGWRLARDETPSRAPETFLVGDETRYFCLDLKSDDAGLETLFAHLDEIRDDARRKVLHGTFLETLPLPNRRTRLKELAPFTVEGSLVMSDPSGGPQVPLGWAARGTFSHGVLRMRAGLKTMRWMLSRDETKSETIDIEGVAVTTVHDDKAGFALATVGNRVLAASDASRMRVILESRATPPLARLEALHREVKLDGEDAWAFVANLRVGELSKPLTLTAAAASFDVNARGELAFKMVVDDSAPVEEGTAFRGTREDCLAVASSFLPVFPAEAIELDGEGAHRAAPGELTFTGRIPELAKVLPDVPKRLVEFVFRATGGRRPEAPSASPTPPSPPQPGGPRSGTPAAPTREGSPRPPR